MRADERPTARSRVPSLPVVIEASEMAGAGPAPSLEDALCGRGDEVVRLVRAHGAVLFRSFELGDARAFEAAMLGLSPLHLEPMDGYFLAEAGRDRVAGTRYCLATSTLKPTGGYLGPPEACAHAENYYSPDVPEVVAFFCAHPPLLGGETALFDSRRAFALLPRTLQLKLEAERFDARTFRTSAELARECARRDACAETLVDARQSDARACHPPVVRAEWPEAASHGVAACSTAGDLVEVRLAKPSVVDLGPREPARSDAAAGRTRALLINAAELGAHGLDALARALERDVYAGAARWRVHRALWWCVRRLPGARAALQLAEQLPYALRRPARWWALARSARARERAAARTGGVRRDGSARTLRAALRLGESEALGRALAASASLFEWRAGDVLLIDNFAVMHDGLPGLAGRRSLCAMLFNARRLDEGGAPRRAERWPGVWRWRPRAPKVGVVDGQRAVVEE